MNRTVALPDNWYLSEGESPRKKAGGFLKKPVLLPVNKEGVYTLSRKFICPKQINDTVTVYFTGNYSSLEVYASGKRLSEEKDEEGRTVFDVTSALRKGSTVISAVVKGGNTEAFYFRVKRKE